MGEVRRRSEERDRRVEIADATEPRHAQEALRVDHKATASVEEVIDSTRVRVSEPTNVSLAGALPPKAEGLGVTRLHITETTAINRAISALRAQISSLRTRVQSLEAASAQTMQQIESLQLRLQEQEAQLRAQSDRGWWIGLGVVASIFFPPAAALLGGSTSAAAIGSTALAVSLKDDASAADIHQALDEQLAKKRALDQQAADYSRFKADIEDQLDRLVGEEKSIPQQQPIMRPAARALLAARNLDLAQQSLGNLRQQKSLLTQLSTEAARLGVPLDASLRALQAAEAKAEADIAASRKEIVRLVTMLATGDPSSAAARWLNEKAERAKKVLVNQLIQCLLDDAQADQAQRPALTTQLLNALTT